MARVTVIPVDRCIVVDGVAVFPNIFPAVDPNAHAIQFYPDSGMATVEKNIGDRSVFEGQAALDLVQPFIDAHGAEVTRLADEAAARAARLAAQ